MGDIPDDCDGGTYVCVEIADADDELLADGVPVEIEEADAHADVLPVAVAQPLETAVAVAVAVNAAEGVEPLDAVAKALMRDPVDVGLFIPDAVTVNVALVVAVPEAIAVLVDGKDGVPSRLGLFLSLETLDAVAEPVCDAH